MGEVNEALKLLMVLLLLLASLYFVGVKGYVEELQDEEAVKEIRGGDEGEGGRRGLFMLGKAKKVVETAGGEVRVVSGSQWKGDPNPIHIGFISMEPNTLFIPQYIDSDLVLFVKSGEAKVGWIYKDKMVEKHLKKGDVNVISAGSAFYVVNTGEGQKLHVICSMDTSESIGRGPYESFFVGGGRYPTSVLAGFDTRTLTAAFNISSEELAMLMRSQRSGPIIYMNSEQMDQSKKSYVDDDDDDNVDDDEDDGEDEDGTAFSWRKMLGGGGDRTRETERGRVRAPHAYNLYAEKPSFENSYGWSIAIDEHDYAPLKHTGVGVYLVNLTAGSMMAPHLNPQATEYGVVLRGSGTVQVVFPNGSTAMSAAVAEGDVFWVPRYFPFCQAASRRGGGSMEFFGFTTSARRNRPQFLIGASSVLRSMRGPELAAAFDVGEEQLKEMVRAQREGVILPYSADHEEKKEEGGVDDMHGGFIIV